MPTLNVDEKVHYCSFKYLPPLLLCLSLLPPTSLYILVSSFARHCERGKKTRQTEEGVGRQHQGMDRSGVRQVLEGSGEQGKMEKTGCKIVCCAPMTLADKGLIMMMIMFYDTYSNKDLLETFYFFIFIYHSYKKNHYFYFYFLL